MARFSFRLQILLDRKAEAVKRAEELLLARRSELRQEQRTMDELESELSRIKALHESKRAERVFGKVDPGPVLACRSAFLQGLLLDIQMGHTSVRSQQTFVDQAKEAVEGAEADLAVIRRELEQLEKAKERAEKKFLTEQAYREELELDEIGTAMYLSRR